MKRFIILAVAALLILPAVSYAGSATSRWDLTVGGFIKFDMGYAFQAQGADYTKAERGSKGLYENFADEYGNFFSAAGETRLNFLVKGPEGWGAKTMGFIEGEFRRGSGYGEFGLRHAFMRMQWANDTLTIGQTWQKWGYIPTYSNILLGVNMLTAFQRGGRQPQIMWDHNFNKNFGFSFGIISPTNTLGTSGGATRVNSFTLSKYPFLEGEITWTSDACGKIGRWQMLFGLSGFYGWDRPTYYTTYVTSATYVCGPSGCVPGRPAQNPVTWDDKSENAWGAAFKGFIPIIPEKKGNKAGALSLSGMLFASQNPGWYMGGFALGSYNRGTSTNPDYSYPRVFGGWGQVSYWFTNNLFISGWYGQMQYSLSDRYKNLRNSLGAYVNNNQVQMERQYIVNLSYDVNPAMRLGLEWDYIYTKYANFGTPISGSGGTLFADRSGKFNAVRIGAWYFF